MKKLGILETIISAVLLIGISTVLFLYTNGYRLQQNDEKQVDLTKTGMISAKSIPEGASVYVDNELETATNDTIAGVTPGKHSIKIIKKGFVEWSKDIEVFEELVTDITAVLVSQSPRLEPLTNTGARIPSISPSMTKLAYFSTDTEKPGIWVIPLSGSGISLFKSNPNVVLQDTRFTKYSQGKSIMWSPDERSLLVEGPNGSFYLVDLEKNTAVTITDPQEVIVAFEDEMLKKRSDFIEKLEIDDPLKQLAISKKTTWSPDDKKFLYTTQTEDKIQYKVYNLESPIPVGEQRDTLVLETNINEKQPNISWYSDSFHLLLVEGNVDETKEGLVSIIRIDGSNKTEVYSNKLYSEYVYSAPGGDKLIVLTSFKSGDQTDLYTITLR